MFRHEYLNENNVEIVLKEPLNITGNNLQYTCADDKINDGFLSIETTQF
jgi:hypothetical protein